MQLLDILNLNVILLSEESQSWIEVCLYLIYTVLFSLEVKKML